MPESVRLCPFHMPFGIPYNLTGDLLALPTIDKRSLHNSMNKKSDPGAWKESQAPGFLIIYPIGFMRRPEGTIA